MLQSPEDKTLPPEKPSDEAKLTSWQIAAAIVFFIATSLIIPFHTVTTEVICAVVGLSAILTGLALEFFKTVERSDERHLEVTRGLEGLYATAQYNLQEAASRELRLMERVADIEENLRKAITAFAQIATDHVLLELREQETSSPLHKEWRRFVLEDIKKTVAVGRIPLDDQTSRVRILGKMIRAATKSCYAYTLATPQYMMSFWNEASASGYLEDQRKRIDEAPGFDLQRVFVVHDSLLSDEIGFDLLKKALAKSHDLKLTKVYLTTYDSVRSKMGMPNSDFLERSFLVIDEEMVSYAKAEGVGTVGDLGYHPIDAVDLTKMFHYLVRVSGPWLEPNELIDPWIRLRKLGKSPISSAKI